MTLTRRTRTGLDLPRLGLGTWEMGRDRRRRAAEVRALRLGFDLGLTLVDTAEMYADGGAEEVVGEALRGRREGILVVSKVLPQNASRRGTLLAAEQSLRRLKIDTIDLYLLHWDGPHPLADTLEAFMQLRDQGKIGHYGVSNFDVDLLDQTARLPGGPEVAANQILYNLGRRGAERRVLPWCAARGVIVMAYSPLEQGRLTWRPEILDVARSHDVMPAQVALAWTLRHDGVVTVVKAASEAHVREDAAAAALTLAAPDLAVLDRAYPAPAADRPLETL